MALVANMILVGLSLILGLRLLRHYLARPRQHTLWYAIGLLLTAVAAVPEVYVKVTSGLPTPLWWLYWMAASALVGLLGAGTAHLISPTFGKIALTGVVLLTAAVVVATIATAGPAPSGLTEEAFQHAPSGYIKLPFVLQSALGSIVILAGALYSYIRTRSFYNILIALGTLVFAAGGTAAGILRFPGVFYFTQTAGIVILYAGVSLSVAPRSAPGAAAA